MVALSSQATSHCLNWTPLHVEFVDNLYIASSDAHAAAGSAERGLKEGAAFTMRPAMMFQCLSALTPRDLLQSCPPPGPARLEDPPMTCVDNRVDPGHERRVLQRERHRANAAAPPASLAHAERRPGASSSTHLDPLRHPSPSEVVVRTTGVPRTLGRATLISLIFRDGENLFFLLLCIQTAMDCDSP